MKYIRLHNLNEAYFGNFDDELENDSPIDDMLNSLQRKNLILNIIFPIIIMERGIFGDLYAIYDNVSNKKSFDFSKLDLENVQISNGFLWNSSISQNNIDSAQKVKASSILFSFTEMIKENDIYTIFNNIEFLEVITKYANIRYNQLRNWNSEKSKLASKEKQLLSKTILGKCNKMIYGIFDTFSLLALNIEHMNVEDTFIGTMINSKFNTFDCWSECVPRSNFKYYRSIIDNSAYYAYKKDLNLLQSLSECDSIESLMQSFYDTFHFLLRIGKEDFIEILKREKEKINTQNFAASGWTQNEASVKTATMFYYKYFIGSLEALSIICNEKNIPITTREVESLDDYTSFILDNCGELNGKDIIEQRKKYAEEIKEHFKNNYIDKVNKDSQLSKLLNTKIKNYFGPIFHETELEEEPIHNWIWQTFITAFFNDVTYHHTEMFDPYDENKLKERSKLIFDEDVDWFKLNFKKLVEKRKTKNAYFYYADYNPLVTYQQYEQYCDFGANRFDKTIVPMLEKFKKFID